MNRRRFLKSSAVLPLLSVAPQALTFSAKAATKSFRRVRPGDPAWPSLNEWHRLKEAVEGRLIIVDSPLSACQRSYSGSRTDCDQVLAQLKNPYHVGDQPGLTQTSGWLDAWRSEPSAYAVVAKKTEDVAAAVKFAREKKLRLVVKGGGHSYKGTSCSADSLLVWTRKMNSVIVHDTFVPQGCAGRIPPQPAVTVGAGAIWMQAYDAVTTKAGRYVQGGGCTTVGVAGLVQSGGFGSFSKNYGTAAAGLLEAEIVTADGKVRIANACTNPDLFWGLKGGGGGSLGVVTKLTLRTRELPEFFGGVFGAIQAKSDVAFRRLIGRIMGFYAERLLNRHWGEQIIFETDNRVRISMVFQGLNKAGAEAAWKPFVDWIESNAEDFTFASRIEAVEIPARRFWDSAYFKQHLPTAIVNDSRLEASERDFLWAGDQGQVSQFLHGYRSVWLPSSLLEPKSQVTLADALFASSRHWSVSLHFNKGLAGASTEAIEAARDTAMNPEVMDAFALAIIAGGGSPAFRGMPGPGPDLEQARIRAQKINASMDALLKANPKRGSYVSESDFFERSWQESFWGSNYPRLAAVKKKYDPEGLFFVHQGVGSEDWMDNGFVRREGR